MVEFVVSPEGADFAARDGRSEASSTGRFIFASATAVDRETMQRPPEVDRIAAEVLVCLDRLKATLTGQGRSLSDIIKLTIYLSDVAFQAETEGALEDYFGAGAQPLYLIVGAGLASGCRVEIELIASAS